MLLVLETDRIVQLDMLLNAHLGVNLAVAETGENITGRDLREIWSGQLIGLRGYGPVIWAQLIGRVCILEMSIVDRSWIDLPGMPDDDGVSGDETVIAVLGIGSTTSLPGQFVP